MDTELFKLLASWGGPGILAWVLWMVSRRYMDEHREQVKQTQEQMCERIGALEKGHQDCEAERQKLGGLLIDALKTSGRKPKRERKHKTDTNL